MDPINAIAASVFFLIGAGIAGTMFYLYRLGRNVTLQEQAHLDYIGRLRANEAARRDQKALPYPELEEQE